MLYLEDYLEMIENLPMEMRDRLTEVRENDLEVQNSLDSLEETVKTYFKKCVQNSLKEAQKTEQFAKIKEAYYKALEETDEKVQIANQIHEIVERHLRKLDHELSKFKMELEADNAGITEILEKRSLETEHNLHSMNRGEKRRAFHLSNVTNMFDKRPAVEKAVVGVVGVVGEVAAREVSTARRVVSASSSPALQMFVSTPVNPTNIGLGNIGTASNTAIQAAASQAIAATQQVHGGRRTPIVKVTVSNNTELSKDLAYARDTAYSASQFMAEVVPARSQRNKKQSAKAAALQKQQQEQQQKQAAAAAAAEHTTVASGTVNTEQQVSEENGQTGSWVYDPNEPRYCLCNEVSYGDMVGCDNPDCPNEWFHYPCVGLTQAPKGKWFCPQCTATMKRRGRR